MSTRVFYKLNTATHLVTKNERNIFLVRSNLFKKNEGKPQVNYLKQGQLRNWPTLEVSTSYWANCSTVDRSFFSDHRKWQFFRFQACICLPNHIWPRLQKCTKCPPIINCTYFIGKLLITLRRKINQNYCNIKIISY